ncbi:MAG TPA: tRNA pseudouridine(55) synthase, partial [Patescibacteria group bacterium]
AKIIKQFIGQLEQVPPVYSAVKVKGKEAYKLARKGQAVALQPRKVEIKAIEIIDYGWPYVKIRVVTGPGVYIRSLARDLGKKLKTGGYLADLERTRVGQFTKKEALSLKKFYEEKNKT